MFVSYRQSRAHGVTVVAGHPVHAVRQVEGAPRPGRELGLLTSATNILYVRKKIFHGPRKYFLPGTRLGHHGEAPGLGRQGEEEEEEHGGGWLVCKWARSRHGCHYKSLLITSYICVDKL